MTRRPGRGILRAAATAAALSLASGAYAASPLLNCRPGVPFAYAGGGEAVQWNPDRGRLGFLGNSVAVTQSAAGFAGWEAVGTASITFSRGVPLPVDVNSSNFASWLSAPAPDGLSPVIYDENGSIFNLLFGIGTGVLGFAGPEWGSFDSCEISESSAWINGGALFRGLPTSELQCVQHHEFGHFINLAHSVVNEQIAAFSDFTGPAPHDTFGFPVSLANLIETMSPLIFIGGGQCDAHADDAASVSNIYPAAGYPESVGNITGTILAPNGASPLTGVNVIARNLADPFADAVSAISSDLTDDFARGAPFVGRYTLSNLTPGADYAVYVDELLAGSFSTPPRTPLPGPEEFYNGGDEAGDPLVDDPSVFTVLTPEAGSPLEGIDIILNGPSPGLPLPLEDDTSLELFLPFELDYCGEIYDSLFVNANGSVTFGGGDGDFSESASDHLHDLPRIAGLWDDLNPTLGGAITFFNSRNDFTVRFQEVPEFQAIGANSFDIVLSPSSDQVEIIYGVLSARDGLAGLSCGGLKTMGGEAEEDLTALADAAGDEAVNARHRTALYEAFTSLDNDLSGRDLRFNTPRGFKDSFERNDTLRSAKHVSLPFNSAGPLGDSGKLLYSDLRPTGQDVDHFRFSAASGQTLIAQVTQGQMDTVLGLFDESGGLVADDDDGGAGLLSRIQIPLPATGTYTLAVSTFPDLDFSGDGDTGGRYVLEVRTVHGLALELGDDDSVEVAIHSFAFPFQGGSYSTVFVNSNGNLTFGSGDADHEESVADLLNGPPRIAPLWDDLSPDAGGLVAVEQDDRSFTVTFDGVPEYDRAGASTFSVKLLATGEIVVEYGAISANDGLAGVTEGLGAADPGPSDLSTAGSWSASGTTYELFTLPPFDLERTALTFLP